jgi:superfamily I DNA and/or RNA helicase
MDWQDVSLWFDQDGFLRDIYILESSIQDWQIIWESLIEDRNRLNFSVDGLQEDPPETVESVFASRLEHSAQASYTLGKQTINCHFFDPSEIEFDFDPRDVHGPAELDDLVNFMVELGRLVSKSVILTHENDPAALIARFDPKTSSIEWYREAI